MEMRAYVESHVRVYHTHTQKKERNCFDLRFVKRKRYFLLIKIVVIRDRYANKTSPNIDKRELFE